MKKHFLKILIAACLATAGCSYNDLGRFAVITGYDLRYCPCCGGLMINFENNTQSFSGDFYLIRNSSDLGIPVNSTFPIYASVTYADISSSCGGKQITITSFRKIK